MKSALLVAIVLVLASGVVSGQWGEKPPMRANRPVPPGEHHPGPGHRDDGFAFCTLRYTSDRREAAGSGWTTDYPLAGRNFGIRIGEITTVRSTETQWVVPVGGPELFTCPFVFASDVGTMFLSQDEAENLYAYLQKGGVLWVDDFWGPESWDQWLRETAKFMGPDWRIVTPSRQHQVFGMQFVAEAFQVSNVSIWSSSGSVAERGELSPETPLQVLIDRRGEVKVVMTHNSDIQDTWEQEAANPEYFALFSPRGYALGINVVLYTMTH